MPRKTKQPKAAKYTLTDDQKTALSLAKSDAKHCLLYGGSRSGKTFLLILIVLARAIKAPNSRHAIFRFRFNHAKRALWYDTIPKVIELCWPELKERIHYDKTDWFMRLPNDSEIWIGGLDDKERTEKILGNEYCSMYFNECSEIPYSSVLLAYTRLAQKIPELVNKFYYDCNPPYKGHWSYKLFVEGVDPVTEEPLTNDSAYTCMKLNPQGNEHNLADNYIAEILEHLPPDQRRRFLLGEWSDVLAGAVYGKEMTDVRNSGRICSVPYDKNAQVDVFFDLGRRDATAMWFVQQVGHEVHLIDYYTATGKHSSHYISILKGEEHDADGTPIRDNTHRRAYNYFELGLPHDARAQLLGQQHTIEQQFKNAGFKTRMVPKLDVEDGHNAVRGMLNRCYFDKVRCRQGLVALESYHYEWDEKMQVFKNNPVHDWAMDPADAFRYLAVGLTSHMKSWGSPLPKMNMGIY